MSDTNSFLKQIGDLSGEQKAYLARKLSKLSSSSVSSDRKELIAWIVSNEPLDEVRIREELRSRLPSTLIPRQLIACESLPKTGSGKVDRLRLAELAASRPTNQTPSQPTQHVSTWTPSEAKLVSLCRTLLRVDTVSPTDNFSALGGDSMRSIQLIAMARERGLMLEPRDIHECATLADLARVADKRRHPASEAASIHESASTGTATSCVTEVRTGSLPGSILLVHEVGGQCHYAHHLAPLIGTDRTLYVTRQQERTKSPKSVVGLASQYVDAWLAADVKGPHVVIAFCWGGLLGYEIARQMKAGGTPPHRLIIIESGTEAAYVHAPTLHRWIDFGRGLSIRVKNRFASLTSLDSVKQLAGSVARKLLKRSTPVTADSGFHFRDDEGDPEQIRDNVQAFLDYAIEPAALPLQLFRVAKAPGLIGTRYSNRAFGWSYLVGNRLSITTVPGDHDTCMQPPNVEHLANQINRLLNQN